MHFSQLYLTFNCILTTNNRKAVCVDVQIIFKVTVRGDIQSTTLQSKHFKRFGLPGGLTLVRCRDN